ncbi:hypothetical protein [Vitreoscilla stercoraria]|uniref:Uncharacterized protein n=1 Tax=Vitreoscilla stercoraria TaxID=61 RepID=A0ABY4ECV7_VITST|nr:hypothetical protein [Vitreoscilla stercoraria]UOO93577.1 hypothetical protein LVJ81_06010 [Vitreoscilla stercoraria]
MTQTTRLTQQDLKIYPSERLTDTDDGGGLMMGTPLTGMDNELFTPISDVDRTMGAFDARLVYPGVLRNDAEPLYGAHFVITEPPFAQNVSYLAFKATKYGEIRREIMPRIEAYSVPTIEGRMTLLGRQIAGSRIIQAYQRVEAPLPLIGQRYCLSFQQSSTNLIQEYFRILSMTHEVRTFEDANGAEFQRRVIKMETSNALNRDFNGVDYPSNKGYANSPTKILETQVADTAKYYGCRPLDEALPAGSASLKVDDIFEKIVPTSSIETAYVDQYPSKSAYWVQTGQKQAVFTGARSAGDLYLNQSVLPGSVEYANYEDNAQGQLIDGSNVLTIDYENAVIRAMPTLSSNTVIQAIPAAKVSNSVCSTVINIDDTNQGTEWAPLLNPKPVNGSVVVSFMSQGTWYDLKDHGDYNLRDHEGKIRGAVARTGSAIISLPAQPDVGSKIVIQWAPIDFYKTIDDKEIGSNMVLQTLSPEVALLQVPQPIIKPGSVQINTGTAMVVDDGHGALSGVFSGRVDYAAGQIYLNAGSSASSLEISFDSYIAEYVKTPFTLETTANQVMGSIGASIAGTVKIVADLYYHEAIKAWNVMGNGFAEIQERNKLVFTDNGNGQLWMNGRLLAGSSIDYATGLFIVPFNAIKADCVTPSWEATEAVLNQSSIGEWGIFKVVARDVTPIAGNNSYCYKLQSDAVRPYFTTQGISYYSTNILAGKPQPCLCVPNSFVFEVDGIKIYERQGRLYQNINNLTGNGIEVGTLSVYGDLSISNPSLTLGTLKVLSGVYAVGGLLGKQTYGYTLAAPVKPQSFTVYANGQNGLVTGLAGENGIISGAITGTIDTKTGLYELQNDIGFTPESVRYNTVIQSSIPLDSSIIGIDAVRLPPDGRVPIFRSGDMIVISNKERHEIGSTFTANQTISLGRTDIDRVAVVDSNNQQVDANKYTINLDNGTLTWSNPLDLSAYALPLIAHTIREEENRVMSADINGRLKLQFPTNRAYGTQNTYVSSALIGGDMLVRASAPFSQKAWTNIWKDERIGDEILAKLNVRDYPMTLISAGAITERWLLRFTSASQFQVIGESIGLILQSDIVSDLSPVNPATGQPYFTLPRQAFGGGWEAQNCIRFNTYSTPMPIWILRAIQPTAIKQTEKDGFVGCLRGNTVDI